MFSSLLRSRLREQSGCYCLLTVTVSSRRHVLLTIAYNLTCYLQAQVGALNCRASVFGGSDFNLINSFKRFWQRENMDISTIVKPASSPITICYSSWLLGYQRTTWEACCASTDKLCIRPIPTVEPSDSKVVNGSTDRWKASLGEIWVEWHHIQFSNDIAQQKKPLYFECVRWDSNSSLKTLTRLVAYVI